jgi:hypothetical protein
MDFWLDDEERVSKLVFIGKNLDRAELEAAVDKCNYSPEMMTERLKTLRFAVGDAVECQTGESWERGKVVALMYRDDEMPPGMIAPYQVQLDSGALIFAPADIQRLIRRAPSPDTEASSKRSKK